MYKYTVIQKILEIFYWDWPIGPPYRMNSGSTYESSNKAISSVSSLSWLSPNYLRVWISPWRYCSKFVTTTNEAWHLLFRVRNSAWVGSWEEFAESFEFEDFGLEIICKIFCWHTNLWLNLSHHLMLNSLERDNEKRGSFFCFLIIFHLRIHEILNLEQNVRSLGWVIDWDEVLLL